MIRSRHISLKRFRTARHILVLLVSAAFFLQSYITQTHIHPLPVSAPGVQTASYSGAFGKVENAIKSTGAKTAKSSGGKIPGDNDDPAKCPLCQAMAYAGQYVWPTSAAIILVLTQSASVVPIVSITPELPNAASYSWQSRAPPAL